MPSLFTKIRRGSLVDDVVLQLRRAIVAGEFPDGAPLTEPDLAQRFGASRAPVREALNILERERLVEFTESGRTRVRPMTDHDLHELVTLREVLESFAARLACRSWTHEDTQQSERHLNDVAKAETAEELNCLDLDWHEYVVRTAHHERLLDSWRNLRPQIERWLAMIFRLQEQLCVESREVTENSHRQLLKAIASGDADRAAGQAAEHVKSWSRWIGSRHTTTGTIFSESSGTTSERVP